MATNMINPLTMRDWGAVQNWPSVTSVRCPMCAEWNEPKEAGKLGMVVNSEVYYAYFCPACINTIRDLNRKDQAAAVNLGVLWANRDKI